MADDQRGFQTGRYTITPELAATLLERNPHNRPISRREVERLKRVLEAGQWAYNGEAIKLGHSGDLLDGQHRLQAIVESGVAADALVVADLEDRIFDTLDQGRKRTGGDVLYTRGIKNHNAAAAACGQVFRMLRNRPIYGSADPVPAYGVALILDRHPRLTEIMELCAPLHREAEAPVVGLGQIAAYVYVLDVVMHRGDTAQAFAEGVLTGAALDAGSPILKLRQKVFDARAKGRPVRAKQKNALLAKVAGLVLSGEDFKALSVPTPTQAEYFRLIPPLKAAVEELSPEQALSDLPY